MENILSQKLLLLMNVSVVTVIIFFYVRSSTDGSSRSKRGPEATTTGYVMASSYSDQMTGSVANVISLQCWAASLSTDVGVVEPFLVRSILGVNMYATYRNASVEENNSVKLGDIYDQNQWEKVTKRKGYAPLIRWKHFLEHSQRNLILVGQECTGKSGVKKCFDCGKESRDFARDGEMFAMKYGFQVVRKVCYPPKVLLEGDFKKLIYGRYKPHEAAVIFKRWGGVLRGDFKYRVGIAGRLVNQCIRGRNFFEMPVSPTITQDSVKYIHKYLPESDPKGYISVMLRMEHFVINHGGFRGKSKDQISSAIKKCYNSIGERVTELKQKYEIDSVFLTMDCRKHGSKYFSESVSPLMKMMADSVPQLYQMLYGSSSSLEKWDESFDTTASFTTPGYVAMLQKHMAAKGICLLTAGGGMFQSSSRELYSEYHPNGPKCVFQVENC